LNQTHDDDGAMSGDSHFDIETFLQQNLFEEDMNSITFFSQAPIEQHDMPELAPMR